MNLDNISTMIKEILSLRYYPSLDIGRKKYTVKDFEPKLALYGGIDGYKVIEKVIIKIDRVIDVDVPRYRVFCLTPNIEGVTFDSLIHFFFRKNEGALKF